MTLLSTTEFLIRAMENETDQFSYAGKYAREDESLRRLVTGEMENGVYDAHHGIPRLIRMLPDEDKHALIEAYRKHVVNAKLGAMVLQSSIGKWREEEAAKQTVAGQRIIGANGGQGWANPQAVFGVAAQGLSTNAVNLTVSREMLDDMAEHYDPLTNSFRPPTMPQGFEVQETIKQREGETYSEYIARRYNAALGRAKAFVKK